MCLYASGTRETRSDGLASSVEGAATGSDCSDEGGPLELKSLDEVLDGKGAAERAGPESIGRDVLLFNYSEQWWV